MHVHAYLCVYILFVSYLVASQYQDKIHLYREYCCWENVGHWSSFHIFSDWFVLGSTCNPLPQVIASKAWVSQIHMVRYFSDINVHIYILHKCTHIYTIFIAWIHIINYDIIWLTLKSNLEILHSAYFRTHFTCSIAGSLTYKNIMYLLETLHL